MAGLGSGQGGRQMRVLGVFAEFETNLRRERQMEGIAIDECPLMAYVLIQVL